MLLTLRFLLAPLVLLLALIQTAHASTPPQWIKCYQHLDWTTETKVLRTECHAYAIPREHRPVVGHWTKTVRQSPHVVRVTRYPTFVRPQPHPAPQGRAMWLWVTGYCLTGYTATGTVPGSGTIASNVLPMGTHVYVPSLGYSGTVLDTGAPLDLWAPCQQTYTFTGYRLVYVTP
jgi:3D (Asp-Asp-Asp) domain-containing protein